MPLIGHQYDLHQQHLSRPAPPAGDGVAVPCHSLTHVGITCVPPQPIHGSVQLFSDTYSVCVSCSATRAPRAACRSYQQASDQTLMLFSKSGYSHVATTRESAVRTVASDHPWGGVVVRCWHWWGDGGCNRGCWEF